MNIMNIKLDEKWYVLEYEWKGISKTNIERLLCHTSCNRSVNYYTGKCNCGIKPPEKFITLLKLLNLPI